jgi:Bax protein
MQLSSLLDAETSRLDEALSKWATLGAIGAATALGTWAGSQGPNAGAAGTLALKPGQELLDLTPRAALPAGVKPSDLPPITNPQQSRPPSQPAPRAPGSPHPNFPKELHGQSQVSPSKRMSQFTQHFGGAVDAVNSEILRDRQTLGQILSKRERSPADTEWLERQLVAYKTSSPRELWRRMDVIPPSLALSQAAIESGWGTSSIARDHNAFFGEKAWTPRDSVPAPGGERYRTFSSPQHSVRAYMRNLNTHPAYEKLRAIRGDLRKNRKSITGVALAPGLEKYSTRGNDYIRQVQGLIQARGWTQRDK